jgi:hypothetical protein
MRQAVLTDQLRPQPRHGALRHVGIEAVQAVGHQQPQNGITQKLQALVAAAGIPAAVFIGVRAVGQRRLEQRRIPEPVPDFLLQFRHRGL